MPPLISASGASSYTFCPRAEELKDRDRKLDQQQRQLDALEEQLKRQQTAITGLKKVVCSQDPQAEVCNEEKLQRSAQGSS
jgi:hypothetical protein